MRRCYIISRELSLPVEASRKHTDLTVKESETGGRTIGGDLGDLNFQGYFVEPGKTVLFKPELLTTLELSDDEAYETAREVLFASFESIGAETVEHS